jgi:hypothetical protein
MLIRLGVRNSEELGHLVVQKAFAGPIRLDPLSIQDELRNRALAGVGNDLGCSAWGGFDVDFGVGDGVQAEETLCLAAIAAPVGGIDKKLHVLIVADAWVGREGYTEGVRASSAAVERSGTGENDEPYTTP